MPVCIDRTRLLHFLKEVKDVFNKEDEVLFRWALASMQGLSYKNVSPLLKGDSILEKVAFKEFHRLTLKIPVEEKHIKSMVNIIKKNF